MEINSGTVLINPSNRESIQVHFEKHLENYSNGPELTNSIGSPLEGILDYRPGRLALQN